MDRVKFLQDALEVNPVQASIISKLIVDIPDEKLTDFIVFRMDFIQPMKSKDLITKEAVFSYKKQIFQAQIKKGKFEFSSVEELKKFIQTYYKGQEVCNGPEGYFDYVVIGMNSEGDLINKYAANDIGQYLKLETHKTEKVYQWLFENPERIGSVEIIPYYETPNLIKLEQFDFKDNDDVNVIAKLENLSKSKAS